jgi:outer membrane protein, heavy metal efflux system
LSDAQRLALANNWDSIAAKTSVTAAEAQTAASHEFPNPTLSLSTTNITFDAKGGLWERTYDSTAALSQLVEIGKRGSRQDSADAGLEAARARMLDTKRQLELAVARAYVAALVAESSADVLEQSSKSLREEAAIASRRFAAGEISASDKTQIEMAAERFHLDARTAELASISARAGLQLLLGSTNADGSIRLTESLETLSRADPISAAGATPRPDVVAAQADGRRAEADVRLQKAQRIPDPTVLVQVEHAPPDSPFSVGVGVSFPLPIWNQNGGAIHLAEANASQARTALDRVTAQAHAEVLAARRDLEDARVRNRTYEENLCPKSAEIRKTIAYAYQKGGASLLDLLAAERNDNDVRLAAVKAAADVATAAAALRAAQNPVNGP